MRLRRPADANGAPRCAVAAQRLKCSTAGLSWQTRVMAALDCFLELDPVDLGAASPAGGPAPPAAASAGAPVGAAGMWAWKRQQQLKLAAPAAAQQAAAWPDEQGEPSACTVSPGCSYSGAAAEGAALLDLADDACSTPPALLHSGPVAVAPAPPQPTEAQPVALPDGTPLAAATFFDDLAAGGSLYQYCLHR
ncbi:hypothetical protein ABPG75_008123 [Micractinium tetrahymenae]